MKKFLSILFVLAMVCAVAFFGLNPSEEATVETPMVEVADSVKVVTDSTAVVAVDTVEVAVDTLK